MAQPSIDAVRRSVARSNRHSPARESLVRGEAAHIGPLTRRVPSRLGAHLTGTPNLPT